MSGSLVRFIRLRGGESPAEQVLAGVYCLVSYGVPRFNVPSESELAAEFDAHPNREEMINAAENECEAGIHPEERLLVALHNYKSAWMLRALGIEDREPTCSWTRVMRVRAGKQESGIMAPTFRRTS